MQRFFRKQGFRAAAWLLLGLVLVVQIMGCSTAQMGQAMGQTAQVVATAPALAHQLDAVYAFLLAQKAVPDHREEATKALAALDAIAPMVQQGAQALAGDNFNWAQFVIQCALTAAQVMGYVAAVV